MKKTSILSLLGLVGFLAFTPAFAQEIEEADATSDEAVITSEETVATDDESIEEAIEESEEAIEEEIDTTSEEAIEEVSDEEYVPETSLEEAIASNPELVLSLNTKLDTMLVELGLNDEQIAKFNAEFDTEEERAIVAAGLGILLILIGFTWVLTICFGILYIIYVIAYWKIFNKAGEKGWKSLIPIYNKYIAFKIVGMKCSFWLFAIILPLASLILVCFVPNEITFIIRILAIILRRISVLVACYKLPRKFNWGVFTSILYVLFKPICALILGFGSSKIEEKN